MEPEDRLAQRYLHELVLDFFNIIAIPHLNIWGEYYRRFIPMIKRFHPQLSSPNFSPNLKDNIQFIKQQLRDKGFPI